MTGATPRTTGRATTSRPRPRPSFRTPRSGARLRRPSRPSGTFPRPPLPPPPIRLRAGGRRASCNVSSNRFAESRARRKPPQTASVPRAGRCRASPGAGGAGKPRGRDATPSRGARTPGAPRSRGGARARAAGPGANPANRNGLRGPNGRRVPPRTGGPDPGPERDPGPYPNPDPERGPGPDPGRRPDPSPKAERVRSGRAPAADVPLRTALPFRDPRRRGRWKRGALSPSAPDAGTGRRSDSGFAGIAGRGRNRATHPNPPRPPGRPSLPPARFRGGLGLHVSGRGLGRRRRIESARLVPGGLPGAFPGHEGRDGLRLARLHPNAGRHRSEARAASIRLRMSRTARSRPENTARAMIACPMLSSRIGSIRAMSETL